MRLWVGAAAVVALVVGGAWLVLAFAFGHLRGGQTAYARSARCLRADRALTGDPNDAARYTGAGLHTLGLDWQDVRAVALFADSLSPTAVDRVDARIVSGLRSKGLSPSQIDSRLLHEDNLSLYYLGAPPSLAAQSAIGRCVYLVHYNRFASALGIYVNPHAERPFLPGARRDER
jgi:hypothetical protein